MKRESHNKLLLQIFALGGVLVTALCAYMSVLKVIMRRQREPAVAYVVTVRRDTISSFIK